MNTIVSFVSSGGGVILNLDIGFGVCRIRPGWRWRAQGPSVLFWCWLGYSWVCLHVLSMLFILCILNPFYIEFCVV